VKGGRRFLAVAGLILALGAPLSAITIKLGSLAPAGSPWHQSLVEVGVRWKELSAGSVALKIYPAGVAGDEQDMIRKMRIGQLQAAGVTAYGLTRVYPDVAAMLLPGFIADDGELQCVLDKVVPFYEEALRERGFQLVMWVVMGWTYVFSRLPVVTPEDLQRQKLWVRTGDANETAAWQRAGFRVVPLSASDVMGSLSSGMIDAVVVSPLAAAAAQWFGVASHMCNLRLSPFLGAVVVSSRTWERIPETLRTSLLRSARAIGAASVNQILDADRQAVTVMRKFGLSVHAVPAEAEERWRSAMETFTESLLGKSVSRESYVAVAHELGECRAP
jgi:TRAP-type C4-dicarboxylate transport system substrate-binding protein